MKTTIDFTHANEQALARTLNYLNKGQKIHFEVVAQTQDGETLHAEIRVTTPDHSHATNLVQRGYNHFETLCR